MGKNTASVERESVPETVTQHMAGGMSAVRDWVKAERESAAIKSWAGRLRAAAESAPKTLTDAALAQSCIEAGLYYAMVGGTFIESNVDLNTLLAVMAQDGNGTGEDVVVWCGHRVMAVLSGPYCDVAYMAKR